MSWGQRAGEDPAHGDIPRRTPAGGPQDLSQSTSQPHDFSTSNAPLQICGISFQTLAPNYLGVPQKYLALASCGQGLTFKYLKYREVFWETSRCLGDCKVCRASRLFITPQACKHPGEAQPQELVACPCHLLPGHPGETAPRLVSAVRASLYQYLRQEGWFILDMSWQGKGQEADLSCMME